MSSILIKNIELPTQEGAGIFLCLMNDVIYVIEKDSLTKKEFIKLSRHGDLIDRDALKVKTEFLGDAFTGRGGYAVWGTDLLSAPVVIPAERSEDERTY